MTCFNLTKAISDRRFSGSKRLCWFAFGDGDGTAGVRSVMYWAACDEKKALKLLNWFVFHGYAEPDEDGLFKASEFVSESEPNLFRQRSASRRQKIKRSKRVKVFARDGHKCAYCGDTDGPFHIDHIYPVSKGGSNRIENLTVACWSCNLSKGCKTMMEWEGSDAQL